ncbi:MAG TPA: DNA primase, partial [Gaiellaceae bacterium]
MPEQARHARSRAGPHLRVAGRITASSIDQVKATVNIVDVVSTRTQLRKSGAGYMGRCPFHEERTPSFSVSPVKGTYHCFGCGVGGDTIRFVQETEQLDFVGAIESLADRYNITLEYEEVSPQEDAQRRRRERLLELLGRARSFYEHYLWTSPAGGRARDYLAGRGLGEEVCREFRLGLSLGGTTLARAARAQGFTTDELVAAGLANRSGNDYFPERLLFPLTDARGRVLGFQARKLREDDPLHAKYVNSPESELFRKGHLLYGLHQARTAIAKAGYAYVVEGNADVLALRQAGFEPVVASMGTALTERQLKELARLTRRLVLCFDGDAAGETATLRAMELAQEQGFDVRVVALPSGLDPADVAGSFDTYVAGAQSYVFYRARLEVERAPDPQEAFVRAREVLARFEDTPERREALAYVAERLKLPKETQIGFVPHRRAR